MDKITEFSGEYRWLSNFWPAPIEVNGWVFPSAEHAYQAAKSLDPSDWNQIRQMTAGQAKRFGRRIKIRPDWNAIMFDVMAEIVSLKFDQHADLKEQLMATRGVELIEGNAWGDTFWGVCRGVGQNQMGKILMAYRDR